MKYTLRTDAEKRRLLADWASSGLSRTQFARVRAISPTSLRNWQERLGGARTPALAQFVDVEVVEVPSAAAAGFVVHVAGRGHRVEVPSGFDAGELRRLVSALC